MIKSELIHRLDALSIGESFSFAEHTVTRVDEDLFRHGDLGFHLFAMVDRLIDCLHSYCINNLTQRDVTLLGEGHIRNLLTRPDPEVDILRLFHFHTELQWHDYAGAYQRLFGILSVQLIELEPQ